MEVAPFFVDFHHFLSIFTIYALLSQFTFCRDLRTFSAIFFGQNSLLRNITRFFACMPIWWIELVRRWSELSLIGWSPSFRRYLLPKTASAPPLPSLGQFQCLWGQWSLQRPFVFKPRRHERHLWRGCGTNMGHSLPPVSSTFTFLLPLAQMHFRPRHVLATLLLSLTLLGLPVATCHTVFCPISSSLSQEWLVWIYLGCNRRHITAQLLIF